MAFLTKRGKYYYVKWNTSQNGKIRAVRKALGTRHKDVAQKMVTELEKLESLGKIDPFSPGFNPKRASADDKPEKTVQCATVTDALNLFYSAKQHLSPATVDAYKRALDHFVKLNGLEKTSPKSIRPHHFENVIFKRGITAATRHYYFRHFRSWWKFLKKKKIVESDIFDSLKEDLPRIRENTRPKMITEEELEILFRKFDTELDRKKTLPKFDPERVQYWFKPIVALYFYSGLRKNEAGYSPELKYSGLKGENLIYEDGKLLTYISDPAGTLAYLARCCLDPSNSGYMLSAICLAPMSFCRACIPNVFAIPSQSAVCSFLPSSVSIIATWFLTRSAYSIYFEVFLFLPAIKLIAIFNSSNLCVDKLISIPPFPVQCDRFAFQQRNHSVRRVDRRG